MKIQFDQIPEVVTPNMRGGLGEVAGHTFLDGDNRIVRGILRPGSTIGLHTHDTNSEIIYILAGTGKVLCDGVYEPLAAGDCHYCPRGYEHSLINDSDGDLAYFAVIPQHGA